MTESYWNKASDPYQYPGSSVLNNIPGIAEQQALEVFEQRATALRLDEAIEAIADQPITLNLWQTIHRILFQDVYAWAGNIRTVQLAKGDTVFAMPEHIVAQATGIFDELHREDWAVVDRSTLTERLTYYFGELNVLHPFREGNGRTQKLLFDEIARRVGYVIHWERMETEALLNAVIAAFRKQDYVLLKQLFMKAIEPLVS